ncbi:adenylate-forming enzyme [Penicillium canescens]|nr:adenylate-forming enzyme [Penicillium canescens]
MGCSPSSPRHELDHFVSLVEPRLILTVASALSVVRDVCTNKGISWSQICLVDDQSVDHLVSFAQNQSYNPQATPPVRDEGVHFDLKDMVSFGESDWMRIDDEATARITPAAMFSTSGTSGLPKAAIRTHHTIISHHQTVHYDVPYPVTRLMALPMSHSFGDFWSNLFPIRYGHPLYVMPRFDLSTFLNVVHRYNITETYLVPAMVHILNQSTLPVRESLGSLFYIGVSGAPIDADSLQRCQKLLNPQACIGQLWGMTEVGVIFQNRYGDQRYPGSIGKLLENYDIRLVRLDDGTTIHGESTPGELYVRGPGIMLAYQGRDDGIDAQGWFRTGDIAYSEDEHYHIVGRTKELIKVRGYSVAPAEIEAVLLKDPRVHDTMVIGITLPDGSTEVPRAYVVCALGQARPTADEVSALALKNLASYKALDGGVIFVESLPRTGIGKPHRSKLSHLDAQRTKLAALLSPV